MKLDLKSSNRLKITKENSKECKNTFEDINSKKQTKLLKNFLPGINYNCL